MPNKRPKPTNNNAKSIDRWDDEGGAPSGSRVTGKTPKTIRARKGGAKGGPDPAAVALGRKGGKARAAALGKRKRAEIARNAAKSRWKT